MILYHVQPRQRGLVHRSFYALGQRFAVDLIEVAALVNQSKVLAHTADWHHPNQNEDLVAASPHND